MEYASAPAEKGSSVTRGLAVFLFLLLILGAAIMIIAMVDIAGTPTCHDVIAGLAAPSDGECYDGSSLQKTIGVILGFAGGGVGLIAAVMAIAYTFTGRRGRLVLAVTGSAILLSGLSILVGSL
jgi:hypothetical protein